MGGGGRGLVEVTGRVKEGGVVTRGFQGYPTLAGGGDYEAADRVGDGMSRGR